MLSLWKSEDCFRKLCFPSTLLRQVPGWCLHTPRGLDQATAGVSRLYHTSHLRCCGITGMCYHVQSFRMGSGDETQTAKVCIANVFKKNNKPPKPCNLPFHTLKRSFFWEHVSNLWVAASLRTACPRRLTGHLETPTSPYLFPKGFDQVTLIFCLLRYISWRQTVFLSSFLLFPVQITNWPKECF